ncbi:hypothetical protein GCM10007853_29370 [Algimonas ampicilliniresistens]|jgi:hypothetical protein|uniref:Putative Flp pilus-assembly TadG-like N-terminal domain-containing protein n=2 Tax=Algimonas ampicilliniresistens TaxID=1298735 RepID=A0ABQ5VCD4_9PROT|nr:hypothetical protein GCM10007853_29370 [Algimonas ampicilliniresistens]
MARDFTTSEGGNVAIMASIGITAILAITGAAIDYTMASSSTARSQQIADAVALSAAIYMKKHGEIPDGSNGGVPPGTHSAASLGYDLQGWVNGGADDVNVNVTYDEVTREAVVTVRGKTNTTFSSIMGFDQLDFSTQATVSFEASQLADVASVALVLDNSGSMKWHDKPYVKNGNGNGNGNGEWKPPAGAVQRISALKTSVNGFMDNLGTLVGDQSGSKPKIVRTGMLAYNTSTISSRTKTMKWQLLSKSDVNSMSAGGGTNSSTSMKSAKNWIKSEDAIHHAANGKTPLKYVVFMTDGVNNNNGSQVVQASGGGIWRRERCTFKKKHKNKKWKWNCYTEEKTQTNKPSGSVGYWNKNKAYDYAWIEYRKTLPDNEETLGYCQEMKDAGATVYTIGFALEEGTYGDGGWGTVWQNSSSTQIAYSFLEECASGPDYFIAAENAEDLNQAFTTIGEEIVSEVIRIKS